jgi:hypothetical protein
LLTRNKDWTPSQRQMMRKATRYHALRAGVLVVLLALAGWGTYEGANWLQAAKLVRALASAETADAPKIVAELAPYRHWAEPLLTRLAEQAGTEKERLHAALALAPWAPGKWTTSRRACSGRSRRTCRCCATPCATGRR